MLLDFSLSLFFFFPLPSYSATELSRDPSFSHSKQPLFRGRQWTVSRMTARCTRIEKRRSVSPCNANCDILWNCPRTDYTRARLRWFACFCIRTSDRSLFLQSTKFHLTNSNLNCKLDFIFAARRAKRIRRKGKKESRDERTGFV